ncbi:programmed cell death protein 1 isoform X2 [Aquila chrysaetos chrysaetos]|uniref:programmed cell death protein 1 isoform X2 n=1 Tax=Aquila chrysaetos chrysaetos TaxID=223781 RepID=UPI001176587E|nr:programmed cell death protein 1 isoform X2 [Aquila chrysaetos chrysaetos]
MAPCASKTMWGSVEVALTGLCAILLCCGPMLASCRRVTFFPAVLTLPAGSSAAFFCNISMENDSGSEYSLNWYKETNHSQAQKIAEISRNNPQTKTEKYLLTNHTPAFKIEILNLHQNDSGSYYCGLITFFEPDKVMESNRSHLVVTDVQKPPSENTPAKEEKPPMVSISTVDYGVLEFQWDQRTQVPPETRPVDQTEYATIVFPEEKPVTPERGKKHQDERTRQLQSQPC